MLDSGTHTSPSSFSLLSPALDLNDRQDERPTRYCPNGGKRVIDQVLTKIYFIFKLNVFVSFQNVCMSVFGYVHVSPGAEAARGIESPGTRVSKAVVSRLMGAGN